MQSLIQVLQHIVLFLIFFYLQEVLIHIRKTLSSLYTRNVFPDVGYILRISWPKEKHEVTDALRNMVDTDGAGTWPPTATHRDSWPVPLRPYHDILLELAPLLPVDQIYVDERINQARRVEYRARLQKLLQERVDISAVESVFLSEKLDASFFPWHACNGFYACIGYLRHSFRWGTIPIVRIAQEEKIINFPSELDIPWSYLSQRYGLKSPGGNAMSNFYCNYDRLERLVYHINTGMSEEILSAEYNFVHSFMESEKQAFPIYHHVAQSIVCFDRGNKNKCNQHLKAANKQLSTTLKVYYNEVLGSRIPPDIFMAYIQGFYGWAAGEMLDGKYTEYDGLSGGHLVIFNLLDVFLGLDTFIDEAKFENYITSAQRGFIASVKKCSFRDKAKQAGDVQLEMQLNAIAKQLRTFRSAHRKRTTPYMSVYRPERMVMTAGASTLGAGAKTGVHELVKSVDTGLGNKMRDTM